MNRLDGKVALISGAARGIGAETARLMVEAGARVVIGDILEERGRETARTIGTDASAVFQRLDVTSEEDWNAAIGAATARWGGFDILVNNAGMFLGKGIEEASLDGPDHNQQCRGPVSARSRQPAVQSAASERPVGVRLYLTPAMDKP